MNQLDQVSEVPKIGILLNNANEFMTALSKRFCRQHSHLATINWNERCAVMATNKFRDQLPECSVLVGDPSNIGLYLQLAPKVQWIQSSFAGVERLLNLDFPKGCQLTALKSGFGPLISEYVFGNLICHLRQFDVLKAQQSKAHWQSHPYRSLVQLTMTVIGLGDIGMHLATTARQFGMRVLGVNSSGKSAVPLDAVFPVQDLLHALGQSDVVVLALPATKKTCNLMSANAFNAMKQGALFFNVGRGCLVDDVELLRALDSGRMDHAWLDVFRSEPLPPGHQFWLHPKVTVTPHMAAVTFSDAVAEYFADNLVRWLQGETLLGLVDLERGY